MTTKPSDQDYLSKAAPKPSRGIHLTSPSPCTTHATNFGLRDGTVKIWDANTYRLENTLNYAFEHAWCVVLHREVNEVAVGFDDGAVVQALPGRAVVLDGSF